MSNTRIGFPFFADQPGVVLIFSGGEQLTERPIELIVQDGDCLVVNPGNGDLHHNHEVVCNVAGVKYAAELLIDEPVEPVEPDEPDELIPVSDIETLTLADLRHRYTTAIVAWGCDVADVEQDMRSAVDRFFQLTPDERTQGAVPPARPKT